jgi:hypothetical protein
MFKETKREDKAWRFDWVDDRGNEFRGLRYYPNLEILSSWSRKPHKMAQNNFHPYKLNNNDWPRIRQACIDRWGGKQPAQVQLKPLIQMAFFRGDWRTEEWMKQQTGCGFDYWKGQGVKLEEKGQ